MASYETFMTETDKQCLISALRAVANLSLQSISLQAVLDEAKVPDWKLRSDRLCLNPEFWPEGRALLRQAVERLEQEPAETLDAKHIQALLLKVPTQGKPS